MLLVLVHLAGQRRAGPHEGHGAVEHVDELRQLVQAEPAHPLAGCGHAGIILHLEEHVPLRLIGGHQGGLAFLGVRVHGTELEHPEPGAVNPHALLREERGTAVVRLDQDAQHEHHGEEDDQRGQRTGDVDDALDDLLGPGETRGGHVDQRQTHELLGVDPGSGHVREPGVHDQSDPLVRERPSQVADLSGVQGYSGGHHERLDVVLAARLHDPLDARAFLRRECVDGYPHGVQGLRQLVVRGGHIDRHGVEPGVRATLQLSNKFHRPREATHHHGAGHVEPVLAPLHELTPRPHASCEKGQCAERQRDQDVPARRGHVEGVGGDGDRGEQRERGRDELLCLLRAVTDQPHTAGAAQLKPQPPPHGQQQPHEPVGHGQHVHLQQPLQPAEPQGLGRGEREHQGQSVVDPQFRLVALAPRQVLVFLACMLEHGRRTFPQNRSTARRPTRSLRCVDRSQRVPAPRCSSPPRFTPAN